LQQLDERPGFDHDDSGKCRRRPDLLMPPILLHHSAIPAPVDTVRLERWMAILPPEKAAGVARMRSASARAASLLGIALLYDCAAAAGLARPPGGALRFPDGGKPAWPSGPDFSISHAAQHVACAIAPAGVQVGLDIEPAGAAERAGLRLLATESEHEAYAEAGLTTTDLWTAKEAVAKLVGAGIAVVAEVSVTAAVGRFRGREYMLARPDLAPGLRCTVAMSVALPVVTQEVASGKLLG
jgi:phosphopantetheinyl transferase